MSFCQQSLNSQITGLSDKRASSQRHAEHRMTLA
jgi:hypothetical protein